MWAFDSIGKCRKKRAYTTLSWQPTLQPTGLIVKGLAVIQQHSSMAVTLHDVLSSCWREWLLTLADGKMNHCRAAHFEWLGQREILLYTKYSCCSSCFVLFLYQDPNTPFTASSKRSFSRSLFIWYWLHLDFWLRLVCSNVVTVLPFKDYDLIW